MRKLFLVLGLCLSVLGITTLSSTVSLAAELKTITLSVDKMTCNMCPITVKKALRKVDGVSAVSAKYEGDGVGWAKVSYDPSKTNIEALTYATEMAGYPSRLQQ
jgi:periplasmic mercuric ion binding protein